MFAAWEVVSEEEGRAADLSEDDVEVAVAIDVREGGAAADDGFEEVGTAFAGREGFEADAFFVAAIPEELRGLAILLERVHAMDFGFEMAVGGEHVETAVEI